MWCDPMNDPQWVGNVLGGTEYIGTHVVQFIVEAASVAHRLSVLIPPPQGGGCSLAVGAARTLPPRRGLQGDIMRLLRALFPVLTSLRLGLMSGLFWPFIL